MIGEYDTCTGGNNDSNYDNTTPQMLKTYGEAARQPGKPDGKWVQIKSKVIKGRSEERKDTQRCFYRHRN